MPQMLTMMVDLEDDEEWAQVDELEDDDFDRYEMALETLRNEVINQTLPLNGSFRLFLVVYQ